MPFPDANNAVVTEVKAREYLLNPMHLVGGAKAAWFASLGYTSDNWEALARDLQRVAKLEDNFVAPPSPFGVKYKVSGTIGLPGFRPTLVTTVWIIEKNSPPRLITAYPG